MKTTEFVNTLPPTTIYDVLHAAEAAGIELPEEVDQWWLKETDINEQRKSEG
jgi:hypothetical protein